jgi:hypothetical protein
MFHVGGRGKQQDDNEFASNYPSSQLKRQREAYAGIHKSGGKRKKVKR